VSTNHIGWSPDLFAVLLEELHVDDMLPALVGDLDRLTVAQYPQAIALTIAIRHSWREDDLAEVAARLGIDVSRRALGDGHRSDHRRDARLSVPERAKQVQHQARHG
jgi:hypothetical protein